ncbi:Hypothetical predicted protein, partial [Pelobates cultripes]
NLLLSLLAADTTCTPYHEDACQRPLYIMLIALVMTDRIERYLPVTMTSFEPDLRS